MVPVTLCSLAEKSNSQVDWETLQPSCPLWAHKGYVQGPGPVFFPPFQRVGPLPKAQLIGRREDSEPQKRRGHFEGVLGRLSSVVINTGGA